MAKVGNRTGLVLGALAAASLLMGCGSAAKRALLPVADRVCLQIEGLPDHEREVVEAKAREYFIDYGFKPSRDGCDATVSYRVFAGSQSEVVAGPIWLPASRALWSQEGIVKVTGPGGVSLEDTRLDIRGQKTKLDLLDALGWKLAEPFVKHFRASAQS